MSPENLTKKRAVLFPAGIIGLIGQCYIAVRSTIHVGNEARCFCSIAVKNSKDEFHDKIDVLNYMKSYLFVDIMLDLYNNSKPG